MAEFPALPLFTDAYIGDTQHLTTAEHGAYLLLLIVAWRTDGCRVPDDDAKLARITKQRVDHWRRMRPTIEQFFDIHGGYWYQGRLSDEYAFLQQQAKTNSAKGRRGAAKRWGKKSTRQTELNLNDRQPSTDSKSGAYSGTYVSPVEHDNSLNNNDRDIAGASPGQCPTDSNPDPTQIHIDDDDGDVEGENRNSLHFDPMALAEHLTRIAGVSNVGEKRILSNVAQVREWLDLGADPAIMERVIVRVRDADERTIHSLKFFNAHIRREFAKHIYPKAASAFVKQIVDPKLKRYVEQKIEAPPDPVEPIPDEEIFTWSQTARDVALRQGWITREQHRKSSQGP